MPPVLRMVMVVTPRSFKRRHPLRKDGRDGGVPLQVDAADLARAVVDVEVAGDQLLLGLELERPAACA